MIYKWWRVGWRVCKKVDGWWRVKNINKNSHKKYM
jgi:hypothetical protein